MKYYKYTRDIINNEIISLLTTEGEEYSFGADNTFLVATEEVLPTQNSLLKYEEITYDQFQSTVNSSDQIQRNKAIARDRIGKEVGDIHDLLADVSKRLAMNERLLMRLTSDLLPALATDSYIKTNYGDMINSYLTLVDNGGIVDRVDYEDIREIFGDLVSKSNKIGKIVNEDYLQKKF